MSIWADLLLMYTLNVAWLAIVIAVICRLAARWLTQFGAAAVCRLWRAGIIATSLLPLITFTVNNNTQGTASVADGTVQTNAWSWLALALLAVITIRAIHLLAGYLTVLRINRRTQSRPLPAIMRQTIPQFRGPVPQIRATSDHAAYTAGLREPILVLPERYFTAEPEPGTASILGHELAHIERRDYAWNLLLEVLTAATVFHPAVAYMKRAADLAREQACDELVVERISGAADYAAHLLEFAKTAWRDAIPAQAMTVLDGHSLEMRVRNLLQRPAGLSTRRILTQATLTIGILATLAAYIPPRILYVDFAPRPDAPNVFLARFVKAPPPPPPPPSPRASVRRPPPPPPPPPPAQ